MMRWEERPPEVAYLLNPAFCGEVLRRALLGYQGVAARAMPYPLLFLILPIALHKLTRESLTPQTRQMHSWLQANPQVRIDFARRAKELVPITGEAFTFLLQNRVAMLDIEGGVKGRNVPNALSSEGEVTDCFKKAELVGRLMARAGSPSTLYTMWGVRP